MSTRSVRLDAEAEEALNEIIDRTGLSITDAIKKGLITYRQIALESVTKTPSDFFNVYDLGEGGYSAGPAREAKTILKAKLKSRRRKD